jgi:hypothetical protein
MRKPPNTSIESEAWFRTLVSNWSAISQQNFAVDWLNHPPIADPTDRETPKTKLLTYILTCN